MRTVAVFAIAACACGGGDAPSEVTITTLQPPRLLVVRDDAEGAWLPLVGETPTTFRYTPAGPYRVTAGCDEGDGLTSLWQLARTPEDGPELAIPCGSPSRSARVTTTMVQAGAVSLDDAMALSGEPGWAVQLDTVPGTKTLVATSDTHILIQRDLPITGPTTLPAIDVVAQGVAYIAAPITVTNAASDEAVSASVGLVIDASVGFVYSGAPEGAKVVPASALAAGDEQHIIASADRGSISRYASALDAGPVTLTLPEPLADARFAVAGPDASVTWSGGPAGLVTYSAFASSADFSRFWYHQLELTEAYAEGLDREATLELAGIPDVPSELLFDYATEEHERSLTIDRDGAGVRATEEHDTSLAARGARRRALAKHPAWTARR